jgi:hypothetical protein
MKDVRFGLRMLLRTPMLSLIATVTFGLGAGSTAFIYMVTTGIQDISVPDADRLMQVVRGRPGRSYNRLVFHEYRDLRQRQTSFVDLAAYYSGTMNLANPGEPPQRLQGGYVTSNAFDGLGVSAFMGRAFRAGDDLPGAPSLLLLGFDAWTNQFAADPDVVGQSAMLNGEPATIIGVMPEGFGFPQIEEAWTPLRYDAATLPRRGRTGSSCGVASETAGPRVWLRPSSSRS